ncbi:MAG: molecular chaperone DnaJ [Candidatus Hydrogenedens sp.]|jgi:molecular chaperone DnaJ|nr:molecular chaperone DnaJ [Candidatus Hydrogenedens sp.]
MPAAKDLYEILGVPATASQEEIRKAYLKLAHKYHPDKTGGDKEAEDKLKEINAAYDVLKNPEKRQQYDRFGTADGQPFGGFEGGFGGGFEGGFGGGFGDIFDMLFGQQGGRQRANRPQPGHDLEYELLLTMEEVVKPLSKKISFARKENCSDCNGSGAARGSRPETCPDCQGTGQVRSSQGFFSMSRPCARCSGTGLFIAKPCQTCKGKGQVRSKRDVSVNIPAGVDTGMRLRLAGEGEAGLRGGPRGDLYIRIKIAPHPFFERVNEDVYCTATISFTQAALGATIRVPTLTGMGDLKVPPGTQSGAKLRLRGHGYLAMHGFRQGDQFVLIHVETPQKLSRPQRELLEKLESQGNAKTYPKRAEYEKTIENLRKQKK